MKDSSRQNKEAWEFHAYDFWVTQSGTPSEKAKQILADPVRPLRFHKRSGSASPCIVISFESPHTTIDGWL